MTKLHSVFRISLRSFVMLTVVVTASACEKDAGGFGEPEKKDIGNHVKKIDDPSAATDALPDFAGAVTLTPSYDPGAKQLMVTLEIKPGFHAYGPGEKIGRPVALTVDAASGWAVDGTARIPAGVEKDLGELGKSMILEGRVPVEATLSSSTPDAEISGVMKVQICTDKACDRPRDHAFKLAAK